MIVTARDEKLITALGDFGVLSTRQLGYLFFKGIRKTTVLRRLRCLEKRELIRRVRGLTDGSLAWCLTGKCSAKLGFESSFGHVNRNTIDHDVRLNDLRLSLASVGLGENWTPEHILRRKSLQENPREKKENRIIPDGIFTAMYKGEPKAISVELELHAKNRKRYRTLLDVYRSKQSLWSIWYIVPTKSLGLLLQEEWARANRNSRNDTLMWSLLSEVLNDPWNIRVQAEHYNAYLRQFVVMREPKPRAKENPAHEAAHPESGQTIENTREPEAVAA